MSEILLLVVMCGVLISMELIDGYTTKSATHCQCDDRPTVTFSAADLPISNYSAC